MKLLKILIGWNEIELKMMKIGSCGSRFGEETSEIWCLEVWGRRGATRKGVAAQRCWFTSSFIKRTTGNRLEDIVIDYKADVLL